MSGTRPPHWRCKISGGAALYMDLEDNAQYEKAVLALDLLFYQRTRGKHGKTDGVLEAIERNLSDDLKVLMEEFAHVLRHEVF